MLGLEVLVDGTTCDREDEWGVTADLPFLPFFTRRLQASWHPDLADT